VLPGKFTDYYWRLSTFLAEIDFVAVFSKVEELIQMGAIHRT
jgi:hypothetical protein